MSSYSRRYNYNTPDFYSSLPTAIRRNYITTFAEPRFGGLGVWDPRYYLSYFRRYYVLGKYGPRFNMFYCPTSGRYNYTPIYYSPIPRTIRRDYVTTTTERRFGGPLTDYNYTYETTTKRSTHPPSSIMYDVAPDYRSTVTTTKVGPYGVTTRTYRY